MEVPLTRPGLEEVVVVHSAEGDRAVWALGAAAESAAAAAVRMSLSAETVDSAAVAVVADRLTLAAAASVVAAALDMRGAVRLGAADWVGQSSIIRALL